LCQLPCNIFQAQQSMHYAEHDAIQQRVHHIIGISGIRTQVIHEVMPFLYFRTFSFDFHTSYLTHCSSTSFAQERPVISVHVNLLIMIELCVVHPVFYSSYCVAHTHTAVMAGAIGTSQIHVQQAGLIVQKKKKQYHIRTMACEKKHSWLYCMPSL